MVGEYGPWSWIYSNFADSPDQAATTAHADLVVAFFRWIPRFTQHGP